MGSVGDSIEVGTSSWTFGGNTANTFDSHVRKSVPLYEEGHDLICKLSEFFVVENSRVVDIGCSTGTLLRKLNANFQNKKSVRLQGIDIIKEMIDKCRELSVGCDIEYQESDPLSYEMDDSDLIISYYTLQFIHPSVRQLVVENIYNSLRWGGAFILYEKVRAPDARFQDIYTTLYNQYKLSEGYTHEAILNKSLSLKGVLEPFSDNGNLDMLKRAGFKDIVPIMRYLCFAGYLAIK